MSLPSTSVRVSDDIHVLVYVFITALCAALARPARPIPTIV